MTADVLHAAYSRTKWSLIIRGVIRLAVGVWILARPMHAIAAFAILIALWALMDGVVNIARGFALRGAVRHWGWLVFMGLVGVAFGGAALYYMPTLSLAFAVTWVSLWLLISGATAIYIAVQERRLNLSWGWTMTFGVVAVVGALMAYRHPGMTLAWLMGFVAALAIIEGVAMLVGAGRLSSAKRHVEQTMNDVRREMPGDMRSTNPPTAPPGQTPENRDQDRGNRAA